MVDSWSDYSGCWADVYDDDHEEMRARRSLTRVRIGLCAQHHEGIDL